MNDPLVLILFLATWGGIVLLFRRLTDDFRKATVRQSENPAQTQVDEELLRITGEVQETIEGLSDAIGKRAEQLRTLIAEADTKIEQLHAASATARDSGGPGGRSSAASEVPAIPLGGPGERSALRPAEPQLEPTVGRAPAAEVLRLAANGTPIEEIARLTNRGREEVRLLLGTRH